MKYNPVNRPAETLIGGLLTIMVVYTTPKFLLTQDFTELTTGPVVTDSGASIGSYWGDFNGDGYQDLFVTNGGWVSYDPNFLYVNNGDGTFTKVTEGFVVNDSGPSYEGTWGDCDNDGDLDLVVSNGYDFNTDLYFNNGDGTFDRVTDDIVVMDSGDSRGSSWADYDVDGYLDLIVINKLEENFLYSNNGDGTFSKITSGVVVTDVSGSVCSNWADYDNDEDPDLFVSNNDGENNILYQNNGDGSFTKITDSPIVADGGDSRGGSWADYDNDGDFDLFVTNVGGEKNYLYRNDVDGGFVKITSGSIVNDIGYSVSGAWGDYDNDGDLDIFVTNTQDYANFMYENNGDGTFTRILSGPLVSSNRRSRGASWADYDMDGDLDLFVANMLNQNNQFYINNGNENHWINIEFIGTASNTSAIGTVVKLKVVINEESIWQMRQIASQTGTTNQNSLITHFGLGSASMVDSLVIEWPSGLVETLVNIPVDQILTLIEGESSATVSFTLITEGDIVSNTDFSLGSSWADVDNDGDEDAFITNGGWYGYETNDLYLNNGDGTFTQVTEGAIVENSSQSYEATWGDPDNDGDLDLYVVNGYGENNNFYENQGIGTFNQWITGSFVNDAGDGRGAAWADVNNDGNLDLIVTNDYSEQNMIYMGAGDLTFSEQIFGLETGRSHNPSFADFNNDGYVDLFIANRDYESNFLYYNMGDGTFDLVSTGPVVTDLGESRGGSWGDYDNDGDLDLFVTNASSSDNFLYRNEGSGTFTKITEGEIVNDGGTSNGAAWGDYDNDGDLDLYVSNAELQYNFLYDNNGDGTFTKNTGTALTFNNTMSKGGSWADIDNDGDLDLLVACSDNNLPNELYINNGNENHWLKVKCIGTSSNTAAIGAKVQVQATVGEYPALVWQMREISAGTGRLSQNSLIAHFGLGSALMVDSLVIEWPSGLVETLVNIPADQMLTLTEGESTVTATFSEYTDVDWGVMEGGESYAGAWGDYDNDDDLDLVVPKLYDETYLYENQDGTFSPVYTFLTAGAHTAVWGDFDNDDTLELYIGGADYQSFWQLDGEEGFVDITEDVGLGGPANNIYAASWVDFDNDGDIDLFTVNLDDSPPRLWRNDDSVFIDVAGDVGITGT